MKDLLLGEAGDKSPAADGRTRAASVIAAIVLTVFCGAILYIELTFVPKAVASARKSLIEAGYGPVKVHRNPLALCPRGMTGVSWRGAHAGGYVCASDHSEIHVSHRW